MMELSGTVSFVTTFEGAPQGRRTRHGRLISK